MQKLKVKRKEKPEELIVFKYILIKKLSKIFIKFWLKKECIILIFSIKKFKKNKYPLIIDGKN